MMIHLGNYIQLPLYLSHNYVHIGPMYIILMCIGGQRGGAAVPRPPPPFRKKWSENAPERVNFSKFSWTQQHLKSRPPPLLKSSDRACQLVTDIERKGLSVCRKGWASEKACKWGPGPHLNAPMSRVTVPLM